MEIFFDKYLAGELDLQLLSYCFDIIRIITLIMKKIK